MTLLRPLGNQLFEVFLVLQLFLRSGLFLELLEKGCFLDLVDGIALRLSTIIVSMVAEEVIPRCHLHFVVILSLRDSVTLRSVSLFNHFAVFFRRTVHITEIFLLLDKIYFSLALDVRHLVFEELLHLLIFAESRHLLALRLDSVLARILVDDLRPELVLLFLRKLTHTVRRAKISP